MKITIIKSINCIKFPKILKYENFYYIFGIESMEQNNLTKFIPIIFKYNLNFNIIKKINITYKSKRSVLIWNIEKDHNNFIFLIEEKSIDLTTHKTSFSYVYVKKENIEEFIVEKKIKIQLPYHLIFKRNKNIILSSKIETDEENPNYYWGKYLFSFYNNKNNYIPTFDNIVNYSKDKGHIIHYIEKIYNYFFVIFSIRHKYENKNEYYYNIYTSKSLDLINFYDTKIMKIKNNITYSKWYCYPEVFKQNNEYYILLNQDDFGKNKNTLIGQIIYNENKDQSYEEDI